jgi:hypothetical protein
MFLPKALCGTRYRNKIGKTEVPRYYGKIISRRETMWGRI